MNKWDKLNKRLEEYDKLFGEQERKEYQERKENAEFVNPDTFKIEHSLNSIGV